MQQTRGREKEKDSQSDEFQAELTGFVSRKRLKMTRRAEEVDQVRQKRNDQTLIFLNGCGGTGVFSIFCKLYFAFISSFSSPCIVFDP